MDKAPPLEALFYLGNQSRNVDCFLLECSVTVRSVVLLQEQQPLKLLVINTIQSTPKAPGWL